MKQEEEHKIRRVELRPRAPEPMSLGVSQLPEDDDQHLYSPKPPSIINELFQREALSNQLVSAVELSLSSSSQAQHAAARNTIAAKVVSLSNPKL